VHEQGLLCPKKKKKGGKKIPATIPCLDRPHVCLPPLPRPFGGIAGHHTQPTLLYEKAVHLWKNSKKKKKTARTYSHKCA